MTEATGENEDSAESNPIVFLDLKIGNETVGRVIIELYKNLVPKTAENFRALCVGNQVGSNGKKLHYKGSNFHKVLSQYIIQGGDVSNFNGTGGDSIYGQTFNDEIQENLKHDAKGILSTVAIGENQYNSQFIITLTQCSHLDGSCVVFGKVLKGFSCVQQVSEVKTTEEDTPVMRCMIEDCGELQPGEPWNFTDNDETSDKLPPDPDDSEINVWKSKDTQLIDLVLGIRKAGNHFFAKSNFPEAHRKYKKALRYLEWIEASLKFSSPEVVDIVQLKESLTKEKMSLQLNLSSTNYKNGFYRESLNLCDKVIQMDKNNAKAWFKKGRALMRLNDYEGALMSLKIAQSILPNKSIACEINHIHRLMKNYLKEEKKVFAKMFPTYK